jgi:hypothetical protein
MEALLSEVIFVDNDLHTDFAGFDDDAVDLDGVGAAVRFTAGGGTFDATSVRVIGPVSARTAPRRRTLHGCPRRCRR